MVIKQIMKNNPLVSIIIPTYNRAHLIGETLDSVLAQTYTNWECIIVDDGSSDNTDEVVGEYVKKDARFQYHKRPDTHKPGGNGARNYGFELSKGEYVNWFDSDDLMHREKLEIQVKALDKSDYNFSVCQTLVFERSKENVLGLRHEKIESENVLEDFIKRDIVFLTPSALYRKVFLKERNLLFDEELKAAQEWEFICRVLYYSSPYHYIDIALVYVRKHNESISHSMERKSIDKKKINYFLARSRVYCFLNSKEGVLKKSAILKYLKDYIFNIYIYFLFKRDIKRVYLIYHHFWLQNQKFSKNFNLILYSVFVLITKKGYGFKNKFK